MKKKKYAYAEMAELKDKILRGMIASKEALFALRYYDSTNSGTTLASYLCDYYPGQQMNEGYLFTKERDLKFKAEDVLYSPVHIMAMNSDRTGWSTQDLSLLLFKAENGVTVAELLLHFHPTWVTDNQYILNLECRYADSSNTLRGIQEKKIERVSAWI